MLNIVLLVPFWLIDLKFSLLLSGSHHGEVIVRKELKEAKKMNTVIQKQKEKAFDCSTDSYPSLLLYAKTKKHIGLHQTIRLCFLH